MLSRVVLIFSCVTGACSYPNGSLELPAPDDAEFELSVYPILLRDCGFPACHGAQERFFRVYGPGRSRLLHSTLPYDPATPAEIAQSFARARSMLKGENGIRSAPLLRKPLAVSAGGAGHEGDDLWDQSPYASTREPSYRMLLEWALSVDHGSDEAAP